MTATQGFRGALSTQVIVGGNGGLILAYDGTPAHGNLIFAVASTAGTDSFGNAYPAGVSLATVGPGSSGGNESIRFGLNATTPADTPFIDSIINPLFTQYLEIVGPDNTNTPGSRPSIELIQDLITHLDAITIATALGNLNLNIAGNIQVNAPNTIFNGLVTVNPIGTSFGTIQFGRFTSSFANVGSTSGTLNWPVNFPVGVTPNAQATVTVGSNLDILFNWTGTGSNVSRAWRLFQKGGVLVTGTVTVDWYAIG